MLNLAQERDLGQFIRRLNEELQLVDNNFRKWTDLIEGDQSLKNLIEESKIKDYLTLATQYIAEYEGQDID